MNDDWWLMTNKRWLITMTDENLLMINDWLLWRMTLTHENYGWYWLMTMTDENDWWLITDEQWLMTNDTDD